MSTDAQRENARLQIELQLDEMATAAFSSENNLAMNTAEAMIADHDQSTEITQDKLTWQVIESLSNSP